MRVQPFVFLFILAAAGPFILRADFAAGLRAYQSGDYVTAANEWRPLADAGSAAAQFNLALLYLDGHGVPQSYEQAVEWFLRAADQGYAKAQDDLGLLYEKGQGVHRNYVRAHMWFNICAASGDTKCAAERDLVSKKMKPKDLQEAQRRAAEWKPTPSRVP